MFRQKNNRRRFVIAPRLAAETLESRAMLSGTQIGSFETAGVSTDMGQEFTIDVKQAVAAPVISTPTVSINGVTGDDGGCIDVVWMGGGDAGLFSNGTYSYENDDGSWTNNNRGDEWRSDQPEPFRDFWKTFAGWPWCPPDDGGGTQGGGTQGGGTSDGGGGESGGTSGGEPSGGEEDTCPQESTASGGATGGKSLRLSNAVFAGLASKPKAAVR